MISFVLFTSRSFRRLKNANIKWLAVLGISLVCVCCGTSPGSRSSPTTIPASAPHPLPILTLQATPQAGNGPVSVALVATCGTCVTYHWSFGDGSIGNGPKQTHLYRRAGTYAPSVAATDRFGHRVSKRIMVKVTGIADPDDIYCALGDSVTGLATDGTATLLENCINSSPANTPSPGAVVTLAAGDDIQTAYNALQCGQTLSLAHGVTWKGPFQFTPKGCDDQHWITITTDGAIPAAGIRISPRYLPELATISMRPSSSANMVTGDHLRFTGIAWLKQPGKPLVNFVQTSGANSIIFDRNYAHGNPFEETRRFVTLSGSNNVAVVESWVDEMHCIAVTGSCTDAQAVSGGTGTFANGTYKIVNNYLSAAGENIIFGGGSGTVTPCDIEIRNNYIYKPISWNPNDPTFIGTKYVVKNLIELKNACRVLVEGNYLANTWGGFTQLGYGLLLTPKNQGDACPTCIVHDVTVRYNYFTTTGAAFVIGDGASDAGGWSGGAYNYSLHDLVFDNMQYPTCYGCGNNLTEIGTDYSVTNPPPPTSITLNDVLVTHLTMITNVYPRVGGIGETATLTMGGAPAGNPTDSPQISNFQFTNSITASGDDGFYPTGGGPADNCSVGIPVLADMITACWTSTSSFSGNLIVAYPGEKIWPAGNLFSSNWSDVEFVNYNYGNSGDYRLAAASPFKGSALDGTDPGANIDLVIQYTNGVQQ